MAFRLALRLKADKIGFIQTINCLSMEQPHFLRNYNNSSQQLALKNRPPVNSNLSPSTSVFKTFGRNYASIHEPDYLDSTGPEIPIYDLLNIQIKGYDFSLLEKFAKHVHHTAERIGLVVEDAWPTPSKNLRVTKLKPESTVLETEFTLNIYERNVQISDVPGTLLPVFINIIEASIPTGVSLRIHPHLSENRELRFVPDLQLKELRTQLDIMRGDRDKEKK